MMQIDVQDLVFSYGGADVLQGVMLTLTVLCTLLSLRFFRWE